MENRFFFSPKQCQHHPALWDTVKKRTFSSFLPRQDVTCGFRDLVVTALQMDPVVNEAQQLAVQVLAPSGGCGSCGVVEQDEQIMEYCI